MPLGLRVPGGGGAARAAGRCCGAGRGGPSRATAGVGTAAGPGPALTVFGARLRLSFHFQVIIVLDFSADVNFD